MRTESFSDKKQKKEKRRKGEKEKKMKRTFLGTACGVPQKDRYCTTALIECGDKKYLLDAGAPVTELIRQRNMTPDDITAVFITHMHGDHVDGLIGLADIMGWYYKKADPAIFLPETKYIELLEGWLSVLRCGGEVRPLRYGSVREGRIYNDGVISVTAIKTSHMEKEGRPTFAFMVEAVCEGDSSRVLFTGDLSHSCKDFPKVAEEKEFDLIVTEGAHFDPLRRIDIFKKSKTKKFALTHIGVKLLSESPESLTEFCRLMPCETIIPEDGEEVIL